MSIPENGIPGNGMESYNKITMSFTYTKSCVSYTIFK